MTIAYIVLDQGSFVYTRVDGVLTAEDLIAHMRLLENDSEIASRFRYLLDVRRVTENQFDGDQLLRELCDMHIQPGSKIVGSRCAVVAHDSWWFNVRFQRQCETHGVTMIAFNDPATACMWLGRNYGRMLHEVMTRGSLVPLERWEVCEIGGSDQG